LGAQHRYRRIDLRLSIVKMRAEAQIVAPFAIMAQGGDNICFLQRSKERSTL